VNPLAEFTNELVRDSLHRNFSTPFLERFEKRKLESSIERLMELYPDDPSLGSPFGTGDETFGLSPGFKRMSAICEFSFTMLGNFALMHGSWGCCFHFTTPILAAEDGRNTLFRSEIIWVLVEAGYPSESFIP